MKRYTVACHPTVEDQLAELILQHWRTPLAEQLASAANRIDAELAVRPLDIGTEITPNFRSLVVYPLLVEYTVVEDDRTVTLLGYRSAGDD